MHASVCHDSVTHRGPPGLRWVAVLTGQAGSGFRQAVGHTCCPALSAGMPQDRLKKRPHQVRVEFVTFCAPGVPEAVPGGRCIVNGTSATHGRFHIRERMQCVFATVHGQHRSRRSQSPDLGQVAQFHLNTRDQTAVAVENETTGTGVGRE